MPVLSGFCQFQGTADVPAGAVIASFADRIRPPVPATGSNGTSRPMRFASSPHHARIYALRLSAGQGCSLDARRPRQTYQIADTACTADHLIRQERFTSAVFAWHEIHTVLRG